MAGVAATVTLSTRLNGWLVGVVGLSEVGTMVVGGTLSNITPDTRGFQPLELEYGIRGSGPTDRVAGAGSLTFALNNSASNSASEAGSYTPGHANAIAGWDLGSEIILKITYDGTDYYKFTGSLISIQPDAGQYKRQAVLCVATDYMDDLARSTIKSVAIESNKRADELIGTIVSDAMKKQPTATSYATGQSTFVTAFDNLKTNEQTCLSAINSVVLSELGYCYVKGDTTQGGVLTFEDRHARPKKGAASATFNNTMQNLSSIRTHKNMLNGVFVIVHPRTTDGSATVLYKLTTTALSPAVPAGSSIRMNCPLKESTISAYRVAASSITTPESGEDWVANASADGTGANLTSSVTVTVVTEAANSIEIEISNAHATSTAYLTTLQLRGIAVRDITETVISAIDNSSAFKYGEIDSRIDMVYESNAGEFGNELAKWILNIYKDPVFVVDEFTMASNKSDYLMTHSLAREPGDKITFSEAMTGIAATGASGAEIGYFINGVKMSIKVPGTIHTSWVLAPASSQAAWVLSGPPGPELTGSSELGITTNLGFA